jgi:flagellar protein FliJ
MFTYNLQSVLEYRQRIEEKILAEFSESERNLRKEKELLNGIREQQQALVEELKALKDRACDSRDVARFLTYTEELQKQENRQIEVVREATVAFEEKRKELLEAVKKRKMMETHREHQFQEYRADLILAERRDTDDLSIQRFARREQ